MKKFEVVVIGAGPGGYQTALELGKKGIKTLLIEKAKEKVGGVCLNVGCVPTKSYLESASFASRVVHFQEMGLDLAYNGLNLQELKEKTIALKTELRTGVLWTLEQSKVETLYASARFVDSRTIEADGERIEFEKCVIATGSRVRELPQLPLDSKRIIFSSDVFELNALPKSIAIIGAGAIACEFASFFNAFGVKVHLIGRSERLLSKEDVDVSKALTRVFKRSGIEVSTSMNVLKSEVGEDSVKLSFDGDKEELEVELVLNAAGRVPNCDALNLEKAGVVRNEKGYVKISPSFETSQKNIFAIGDCVETPAFAHTAYSEAKIVAYNIINDASKINAHVSPSTIFTNPQCASFGLKESQAKERGLEYEVKKAYFKANAKAKIHGDDSGFAKAIIDSKSGLILGASVLGTGATEIIHELLAAMENGVTLEELKSVTHSHPTISEVVTYL